MFNSLLAGIISSTVQLTGITASVAVANCFALYAILLGYSAVKLNSLQYKFDHNSVAYTRTCHDCCVITEATLLGTLQLYLLFTSCILPVLVPQDHSRFTPLAPCSRLAPPCSSPWTASPPPPSSRSGGLPRPSSSPKVLLSHMLYQTIFSSPPL